MGWFDEQIRERKHNDDEAFAEAFANMASAVTGRKIEASLNNDRAVTKDAIDEILRYYHVKSREVPDEIGDVNEQLEYLMRPFGIMRRTVTLEEGWYRDAVGAMLGVLRESGRVVALIPTGISGYSYFDYDTGKRKKINHKNQQLFETEAIAFYKPFPLKKISLPSLASYIVLTLSASDFVMIALATLALSLIGMFSPMINKLLFDRVLTSGSVRLLIAITVFSVCVSISTLLISAVKNMITARIETKLNISVDAATMMRIMSLPADFFKQYSAGELSNRASQVGVLCKMLASTVLSAGLTSVFSLIYISQMSGYYEQHGFFLGNVKKTPLKDFLSGGKYLEEVCTTLGTLNELMYTFILPFHKNKPNARLSSVWLCMGFGWTNRNLFYRGLCKYTISTRCTPHSYIG